MEKKVNVVVGANFAGFHREFNKGMHSVKEFANVGEGLKSIFATALGGFTLSAIVEHIASFSKNLEDAAENMGTTVEEAYRLKRIAMETGKDFSAWEKTFRKTEDFLQGLAEGKHLDIAKRLGITSDMRAFTAIQQALRATEGMNRGQARPLLEQLVGAKSADWLMNPQVASGIKEKSEIDIQAVHNMAMFQFQLEMLVMTLERDVLPAFSKIIDWINEKIGKSKDEKETYSKRYATARKMFLSQWETNPEEYSIQEKMLAERERKARREYNTELVFSEVFTLGLWPEKSQQRARKTQLATTFNDQIAEYVMNPENVPPVNTRVEDYNKRKELFEKRQLEIENEIINRTGKSLSDTHTGEKNPFLQIGGLMGESTNRITTLLERTANATENIDEKMNMSTKDKLVVPPLNSGDGFSGYV